MFGKMKSQDVCCAVSIITLVLVAILVVRSNSQTESFFVNPRLRVQQVDRHNVGRKGQNQWGTGDIVPDEVLAQFNRGHLRGSGLYAKLAGAENNPNQEIGVGGESSVPML
jgi:hypothetical protein